MSAKFPVGTKLRWSTTDLINGFTASARSIEYADARIELESRAGKLMALAR